MPRYRLRWAVIGCDLDRRAGGTTDAAARARLDGQPLLPPRKGRRPARGLVAERWIAALTSAKAQVEVGTAEDDREAAELSAQLDAWHRAAQLPAGPVRTCFRLVEPEPAEDKAEPGGAGDGDGGLAMPGEDWRVEFALQSTDDPSLMMPAADVWAGRIHGRPGRRDPAPGGGTAGRAGPGRQALPRA